ncbi:MAG: hypothetical protein RL721_1253 [Candidatus Eisenbacteria bacterium]
MDRSGVGERGRVRVRARDSSLERDVLPGLAARGVLHGRRCEGRFWDIGTPEDWERAEREFSR